LDINGANRATGASSRKTTRGAKAAPLARGHGPSTSKKWVGREKKKTLDVTKTTGRGTKVPAWSQPTPGQRARRL